MTFGHTGGGLGPRLLRPPKMMSWDNSGSLRSRRPNGSPKLVVAFRRNPETAEVAPKRREIEQTVFVKSCKYAEALKAEF